MQRTRTTIKQPASRVRTPFIVAVLLALLVTSFGDALADPQVKRHPRHPRFAADLLSEMRDAVTLVEVKTGSAKAERANVARNRSGTYEAFTLEVPIDGDENNVREVIFIEDRRGGKLYEVRGFDFPRPFTDLAWRGNDTLVFDQWMQPRYAVHYAVNARQGKLTTAATFWERGFEP